jgi:hypothetical protein
MSDTGLSNDKLTHAIPCMSSVSKSEGNNFSVAIKRTCNPKLCNQNMVLFYWLFFGVQLQTRSWSRGRHAPPIKLEKIRFLIGVKSWFFTRNTRKKYKCTPPPPNLKSWIRPCKLVLESFMTASSDHIVIVHIQLNVTRQSAPTTVVLWSACLPQVCLIPCW